MVAAPLTDGELWAREQLEALLARRLRPAAIARFLYESQRRANAIRRERPELARRAWEWIAAGAAAWLSLAAAGREPFRAHLRSGISWWAACAVMLDWHLGMVETEEGRPRQLAAADALTLARAWLVPVAWHAPVPAACLAAAATDALDGPLARRAEPTRAGRDLEGLVDSCFAAAALRGARARGALSRGAAGGELARLAAGLAYGVFVYFGRASAPDQALTRAARLVAPARAAGLVAAGLGRRQAADRLISGASVASVAVIARASSRGWCRGPAASR